MPLAVLPPSLVLNLKDKIQKKEKIENLNISLMKIRTLNTVQ